MKATRPRVAPGVRVAMPPIAGSLRPGRNGPFPAFQRCFAASIGDDLRGPAIRPG
jgi:hypothetical protein